MLDRFSVGRQLTIRVCLAAVVCVSCTTAFPRISAQSPQAPIGRGTTVSPCAQRLDHDPRSASRVVEKREALVKSLVFTSLAIDSLPNTWPAAAPYFSRLFAASWLKNFAAADSLTLVRQPAPQGLTGTLQYLCAWQASQLVSSFALGVTSATASELQTHAVDELFARSRHVEQDSVYASADSAVSEAVLSAVQDTLRLVESILGARAIRPAYVHISSTEAMHAAALPVRPPGTVFSGYTVSAIGLPGISMVAPSPDRYSILVHELAHLALAGAKDPLLGKLVGDLAEEALARAFDGRARLIPGLLTEAEVRRVLSTPALRRALLGDLNTRSSDTETLVNVLGAIYRVSLLRCTAFPLRLLMPADAKSIDAAVRALGAQLGQSPQAVEDTIIAELASGPILGYELGMRRLGCK